MGETRVPFLTAIYELQQDRFISDLAEIAENVYICVFGKVGTNAVARMLAQMLPGVVIPSVHGVTWQNGRKAAGTLIDSRTYEDVLLARETVKRVIPGYTAIHPHNELKSLGWTRGSCARQLVAWAVPEQKPLVGMESLFWNMHERPTSPTERRMLRRALGENDTPERAEHREYQYHDCDPGKYEKAYLYDMKGSYFQLLSRLPSLHWRMGIGGLKPVPIGINAQHRWRDVLEAVEEYKSLRNSIWGTMTGSLAFRTAYTSAAPKPAKMAVWVARNGPYRPGMVRSIKLCFGPGPLRPAGLLVARAGHELCALASEEVHSVYSTVDSVTTLEERRPQTWHSLGITSELKYEGPAEICARGSWKIGEYQTKPYQHGEREYTPVARRCEYETLYHKCFL